jgi:hypothetical protein
MEGREKEMEATGDGSVEPEDPREWSPEKVATFVRSLGAAQCFQSAGDQVLELWSGWQCFLRFIPQRLPRCVWTCSSL